MIYTFMLKLLTLAALLKAEPSRTPFRHDATCEVATAKQPATDWHVFARHARRNGFLLRTPPSIANGTRGRHMKQSIMGFHLCHRRAEPARAKSISSFVAALDVVCAYVYPMFERPVACLKGVHRALN